MRNIVAVKKWPFQLEELSRRLGPKTPRGPLSAVEVLQLAKPLGWSHMALRHGFATKRIGKHLLPKFVDFWRKCLNLFESEMKDTIQ